MVVLKELEQKSLYIEKKMSLKELKTFTESEVKWRKDGSRRYVDGTVMRLQWLLA